MHLPLLCLGHIASIPCQPPDSFRSSVPVSRPCLITPLEANDLQSELLQIRYLHAPIRNELDACGHLRSHGPYSMA
jgi:hypothetical protein